jgi:endoglucanase
MHIPTEDIEVKSSRNKPSVLRTLSALAVIGLQGLFVANAHAISVDIKPQAFTGGYTADVVITNDTATAINGWTLSFKLGNTVTQLWRASYTGSDPYTFKNLSYNALIPAGQTQNFGFNANGTLTAANLANCSINGKTCTLKINGVPVGGGSGGNQAPVAKANGPYSGKVGQAVAFSSLGSNDPDGRITLYNWQFGDGGSSSTSSPSHSYAAVGGYTAKLTVTDDKGATNMASAAVTITTSGGGGTGTTPVARNGQLKVCGTQLCNSKGQAIQLRGMSSHGLQWFDQCNKDSALDALASDWGADVYRLAMYVQEGGYESDPARFRTRVDQLVAAVSQRGMYVIVDWHILNPGDPNANLTRAKEFFDYMSRKHAARNNIIYEIANEPNGVGWATIKSYAEQVIPVIRANDPDGVILVGTRAWSSLGLSDGAGPEEIISNPVSASNIMYSFHFYAASHVDYHRNGFARAIAKLPVFVTEFGTQEFTGDGPNDFTSSQKYIDLMQLNKVSWVNWNFSDDFRSGAVLKSGTCSGNGPWSGSALKPAGTWIRDRMLSPADAF